MIFLNLTNGLEYAYRFPQASFVRIQSTWCEQKHWSRIIEDLDYSFLLSLAKGKHCTVIDCGHNGISRAVYQGIPFIKFILYKYWLDRKITTLIKGHDCTEYFNKVKLSKRALQKLKYFRKFLLTNHIYVVGLSWKTKHDGNHEFYKKMLQSS